MEGSREQNTTLIIRQIVRGLGRDLNTHSPILLEVTAKAILIKDLENAKSGNGSEVIR